ncbi:aquaporin-3 [Eurytemora carolleeae]|uniref:aquaporin-3 n=1 Tax=Eurytemora carolleeae TaxID=1294199 RepID=UPI000C75B893|nr:aquaporin-3 [Eurytemora carolleeae]|eukprot:XP_023348261.1 aquaporin-3-like [Eurytemora affinis]
MLILSFGTGSVAQAVLSHKENGNMFSINVGWGAGVVLGIMASAPISGAHLNPAVTIALAVVNKFPWKKVPHYMISQYIGAFIGAAITLLTYREAIVNFSGSELQVLGENGTAGIFVTFPNNGISNLSGAIDQIVGTALLLICVLAIGLPGNNNVSKSLGPLLVGLTVVAIGACFGHNAGYAINPARDFAPRVLLSISGWGTEIYTAKQTWCWIPMVFCHIGGILGALLYYWGIEVWQNKKSNNHEGPDSLVLEKAEV